MDRRLAYGIIGTGALAVVLAAAVLTLPPSPKFTYSNTMTHENITTSMAVGAGEAFVIRLDSNPSTGYDWHVATSGPVSYADWTLVGGGSGSVVGAPVTRDYHFTASGKGVGSITLVYERAPPAFTTTDVITTIVITVNVG